MLSKSQIRQLRSEAHHLHPVVMIGAQGLSEGVHKEIDLALNAHELIKIKLGNLDDATQSGMMDDIAARHHAELVQKIGHTAVFFRQLAEGSRFKLK
ncbi:MAG: YhbY family RNA-binding protein [Cardiobacteriaceae bacterium]|nr:YhbY family RNA-binding protein [Cardiobacteriaceae bacterium]